MKRRLLTGLAFLAVLAAASATPAMAAGGFTLTPRSGDQFPTRTYLLTVPPGKTATTGTLHVTENGGPVSGLTVTPLTDTSELGVVLIIVEEARSNTDGPGQVAEKLGS